MISEAMFVAMKTPRKTKKIAKTILLTSGSKSKEKLGNFIKLNRDLVDF